MFRLATTKNQENQERSSRAPHQAPDKRYYKRQNFQSSPMEDYEVRDTLRRAMRALLLVAEHDDPAIFARIGPGMFKSFVTPRTGNAWVHALGYHAVAPHVVVGTAYRESARYSMSRIKPTTSVGPPVRLSQRVQSMPLRGPACEAL
jgi:hypothetical protein